MYPPPLILAYLNPRCCSIIVVRWVGLIAGGGHAHSVGPHTSTNRLGPQGDECFGPCRELSPCARDGCKSVCASCTTNQGRCAVDDCQCMLSLHGTIIWVIPPTWQRREPLLMLPSEAGKCTESDSRHVLANIRCACNKLQYRSGSGQWAVTRTAESRELHAEAMQIL